MRVWHQVTARVALPFLQRFEDERLLLRPHAAHGADAAARRCLLEIVEGADAQLAVQRRDGFRPDTLQAKQVEYARREFREELAMKGRVSCIGDLPDLAGEIFADARN